MQQLPNVTGWWVQVVDTDKSSYGQILESICDVPVTSMNYTFFECYYLIDASSIHIPSGVVEAKSCFYGCDNLTTAPELVSSLKDISYMFSYCISLTGDIVVNCEPDSYERCFDNTSNSITLSGSSSKKAEIAATSTAGNVTVKK